MRQGTVDTVPRQNELCVLLRAGYNSNSVGGGLWGFSGLSVIYKIDPPHGADGVPRMRLVRILSEIFVLDL